MKRITTAMMALMMMGSVIAQDWQKEPLMTKSLSGMGINQVILSTSGGNIVVQKGANERIEVFVSPANYKKAMGISKSELEARLKEYYDFELSTDNNTLRAIAKQKKNINNSNWERSVSVSYTVTVSGNVSTRINTSGGNVSLYDLNGKQDFTTSGGNLNLERLKGTIKGTTSGGNINIKEAQDNIDLTTSGGNIWAERCRGDINLTTSGGSVSLMELDGTIEANTSGGNVKGQTVKGNLKAHTSGGNVVFKDMRCALVAGTSGGNVDVEFRELTGEVRLSNTSGSIDIVVPAGRGMELSLSGDRVKTDQLANFTGTFSENRVKGTLGEGGVKVSATAGSGRVSLSFQ